MGWINIEWVNILGGKINFQEFIEERAKDQTKEWLLTEKERFDSELDKNKDGFLNEVEIIALAIPDNNEITTDEVNHLFAGADEYKKRKLLHEVNFTVDANQTDTLLRFPRSALIECSIVRILKNHQILCPKCWQMMKKSLV